MLKVGDRVFDKEVQANGEIMDIGDGIALVRYFWAHYCNFYHDGPKGVKGYNMGGYLNPNNRKIREVETGYLVKQGVDFAGVNSIALVNRRVTDRRLHLVAEIPYAREFNADINIRYGGNLNRNGGRLCINEKIVIDKFDQMKLLGEDLSLRSVTDRTFDGPGWIIKPRRSCGGENIHYANNRYARPGVDYYQEFFPKVREFRAHCFLWNDNPVPFIQEKIIQDGNQLCWNKHQGGVFQYVYQQGLGYGKYHGNLTEDELETMTKMSVAALKRLKYDSGGIDFGMDTQGNFKIFEVNSAMGLRERSLFTYKEVYNKLRHIDINDYKAKRWA